MSPRLSAVLIVKNAARELPFCLQSLQFVDEIIIVDGGSTDQTWQIACQFTPHVYCFDDWQGFGKQRQRAQQLATGDWVLMLDADEFVTPMLAANIQKAIQRTPQLYQLKRLSWCFGRYIYHGGWYPDRVARLYPRTQAYYDDALVHEKLININQLPISTLDGDLIHFTYRDLRHYLEKSASYADAWAQQRVKQGKKASLGIAFYHAIGCFLRMYLWRAGFLDGRAGLLLALLSAHSTFVKYGDLWLRTQPRLPREFTSSD